MRPSGSFSWRLALSMRRFIYTAKKSIPLAFLQEIFHFDDRHDGRGPFHICIQRRKA